MAELHGNNNFLCCVWHLTCFPISSSKWNYGTRLTFDGTRGKKSKGDTDPGQILFVASSLPEDEILRPLRVLEKRLVRLLNKVLVLNKWPINGSGSIHKKKKYGQNPVMKQLLGRLRSTRGNTVMVACPNLVMSCLATSTRRGRHGVPIVYVVECGSAGRLLHSRPACVSSDSRKKGTRTPPHGSPTFPG